MTVKNLEIERYNYFQAFSLENGKFTGENIEIHDVNSLQTHAESKGTFGLTDTTCDIKNSFFYTNNATYGGAVYIGYSTNACKWENVGVYGNSAEYGGGIYLLGSAL